MTAFTFHIWQGAHFQHSFNKAKYMLNPKYDRKQNFN